MTCPGERFADDLARRDECEDAAEDAAMLEEQRVIDLRAHFPKVPTGLPSAEDEPARPCECPWCGARPYDDCHDELTGATGSYDPWGAA